MSTSLDLAASDAPRRSAFRLDTAEPPATSGRPDRLPLFRLPPRSDGQRRAEGGRRLSRPAAALRVGLDGPWVSYVTVVRNARSTLPRTLASVAAQRWPAVEHIVVDGLSTDGTLELIQQHAAQIDYYVSEPDAGLYDALNKACSLARGQLVCVLNADDWLTSDAAAIAVRTLERCEADPARPGPRLIATSAWMHNARRRRLWLPAPLDAGSWLRCPHICHNGVYATQAALSAIGPYDTRLGIAADTRWLLGALEVGVPVSRCVSPTVHYRSGGLSADTRRHVDECARLVAMRFPQLDEAGIWTLMHAFYPWPDNLAHRRSQCPPHLGNALRDLAARHHGDAALQRSLALADMHQQLSHRGRIRARRPLHVDLRRGLTRLWYELRSVARA